MTSPDPRRTRIVVVGGGFAGLTLVRALRGAPVDVTLVDRRNFHLFQPLLYQVATGGLSPANIATPLRALVKRQPNVRVVLAGATGVDVGRPPAAARRRGGAVRHPRPRDGRPALLLRPSGVGGARPGPEDPGGRDGHSRPHPLGLRGGRAGGGRGAAARAPHVRGRGGGAHGGGAGGSPRRDRPAHAPGRVPADRPLRGADPPRGGDRPRPGRLRPRPLRPGRSRPGPARRRGPHGDPRHGHPRGRGDAPAGRGGGSRGRPDDPLGRGCRGLSSRARPRRVGRRRDGPGGTGRRRARPDASRAPGALRGRRPRPLHAPDGQAAPRRRPGRDAAGAARGADDPGAARGACRRSRSGTPTRGAWRRSGGPRRSPRSRG